MVRYVAGFGLSVGVAALVGCTQSAEVVGEAELRAVVQSQALMPVVAPEPGDPAVVQLGQMLFFDRILSGRQDIACATCHHPALGTGDRLPLSIGVAGVGVGQERQPDPGHPLVPRNAPDLYNRGQAEWSSMFWDGRISVDGAVIASPAGAELPPGLSGPLAAQALFPPTSRTEMRGEADELDVFGGVNELATLADDDLPAIWDALLARLLAIPEYVAMFADAFPGQTPTIAHVANAIAAFESETFTFVNSPWDRYLAGEADALSEAQRRGALLFFGDAGCSGCHSGTLFTDQQAHNLCVPQLGPGKGAGAPLDLGRYLETGAVDDRYAFRTPPLRNVTLTAPYMHDGAFESLEGAVRHHLDAGASVRSYDGRELPAYLQALLVDAADVLDDMELTLDERLAPLELSAGELNDLVAFLEALTDPAAEQLQQVIPEAVPSGLPIDHAL